LNKKEIFNKKSELVLNNEYITRKNIENKEKIKKAHQNIEDKQKNNVV